MRVKKETCRKIEQAVQEVMQQAKRARDEVTTVAVTKNATLEEMETLYRLGYRHFGENRADVFQAKKAHFNAYPDITWHFIGTLQTKKVRKIINEIDIFHALDSFRLAHEINARATRKIPCFLEVNVSCESSKQGFTEQELWACLTKIADFPNLKIIGLMTMAPKNASKKEQAEIFTKLKELQQSVQKMGLENVPCDELSMGMSQDFPEALKAGATMIRIGSAFYTQT